MLKKLPNVLETVNLITMAKVKDMHRVPTRV